MKEKRKTSRLVINDQWEKAIVSRTVRFTTAQLIVISTLIQKAEKMEKALDSCLLDNDHQEHLVPDNTVIELKKLLKNVSQFAAILTKNTETLGDAEEAVFGVEEEDDDKDNPHSLINVAKSIREEEEPHKFEV